ncbi:hypothetical protein SDC9_190181 [bioreactor metagenome]|uniref:Uncharacterized protein n=1 Tax=bioreactor metagenome TaxID=1076179 RepID=A0A645I2D1_9ZZZZ
MAGAADFSGIRRPEHRGGLCQSASPARCFISGPERQPARVRRRADGREMGLFLFAGLFRGAARRVDGISVFIDAPQFGGYRLGVPGGQPRAASPLRSGGAGRALAQLQPSRIMGPLLQRRRVCRADFPHGSRLVLVARRGRDGNASRHRVSRGPSAWLA